MSIWQMVNYTDVKARWKFSRIVVGEGRRKTPDHLYWSEAVGENGKEEEKWLHNPGN